MGNLAESPIFGLLKPPLNWSKTESGKRTRRNRRRIKSVSTIKSHEGIHVISIGNVWNSENRTRRTTKTTTSDGRTTFIIWEIIRLGWKWTEWEEEEKHPVCWSGFGLGREGSFKF